MRLLRQFKFLVLLSALPLVAAASTAFAQTVTVRRHVLSIAPVELSYKAQLGYERRLGNYSSLGINAFYSYGMQRRYEGWQATAFYRYFTQNGFPTGLYVQAQASIFNHRQEANLIHRSTSEPYSFDYWGLSGGFGGGVGYRGYVLRRALGGHLLGNVLLGMRMQFRPAPAYNRTLYYPDYGFLGPSDAANWHLGFGPGTVIHGLLSLDYQF